MEINDKEYEKILKLCAKGDKLVEKGNLNKALLKYEEALNLVPNPKDEWEASTWIYAAIGEVYYVADENEEALDYFLEVLKCPDGLGNPFINLRIGQCFYELNNVEKAREYLLQAYMIEGEEIFEDDEGYLEVIIDLIDEYKLSDEYQNIIENRIVAENRRENSNKKIIKMGIACLEELPLRETSNEVVLKNLDDVCNRAIANLVSIQLALSIDQKDDYDEAREICLGILNQYDVQDCLLEKEKRLFDNNYTEQDIIDVVWTYECHWALIWALGMIDNKDFEIPNDICDTDKAIALLSHIKDDGKLRNVEEILDMLDLFYRYHWACVEKRINPNTTSIGELEPPVVMERRRGLEWLFSEEDDWNDISLDT